MNQNDSVADQEPRSPRLAKGRESSSHCDSSPTPRRPSTTGRVYPLNSRRLKVKHLRLLAESLELPTAASADEVRQMVEGTLREMKREPENVQVIVEERRQVVTELTVTMMDETGVLKTIKKTETKTTPTTCNCHCTEELENLRGQRDHLENTAELLTTRLTQLGLQLEDEQAKNRRAWRENCERVQALDAELAEREAELAARDANPQQYPQYIPPL